MAGMSQSDRDKRAIRVLLSQLGEATYPELALRGGEGLASPLLEMVQAGEVVKTASEKQGRTQSIYSLGD